MNPKKRVALIVALSVIALAVAFLSTTMTAQTTRVIPTPLNCSIKGQGEYSRGAVVLDRGARYVCANVRSKEWEPAGVAWGHVDARGNDFILSGPSIRGECERTENRRYSQGAVLNVAGEVARCATVFDAGLRPIGAAWIDVTLFSDDAFVVRVR